jgi:cyclopropane fatty-acyl-phospholipid synthase-like methyltransferase
VELIDYRHWLVPFFGPIGVGKTELARDMRGSFDKIASVGMFEHVGRRRLKNYLATLNRFLRPGGLLLNYGITRPEDAKANAESLFFGTAVCTWNWWPRKR